MKYKKIWIGTLAAALFLTGTAAGAEEKCSKNTFAMDTVMSFTAFGANAEKAVDACIAEISRLDRLLSVGMEESEVGQINKNGRGFLSEDGANILKQADGFYKSTGGRFDYTIYPVMELWGFTSGEYHVPEEEELADALGRVDASRVRYEENDGGMEVTLGEGQSIDFGAIAKGYASARMMEVMEENGVESGMVSLGGNVQVLGSKPDGTPWNIGIRDPQKDAGDPIVVLSAEDLAIVTSGGYERFFEEDGRTYIHIIDPGTGCPVENELASVTIVSRDGTLADAMSTSMYIEGMEGAAAFWKEHADAFEMVLIDDENNVWYTPGLAESIRPYEEGVCMKMIEN